LDEEAVKPCIQDRLRSFYKNILTYIKRWKIIIMILIIAPLLYTRKIQEYILHLIFFSLVMIFEIKANNYISTRYEFTLNKASVNELNAEDNVLLRGVGLFQVVLFLYIGYIEDIFGTNFHFQIVKWTIPFFIFIFFIMRGYAHIKNSPKYRTYSSLLLIYYFYIEIVATIIGYISKTLKLMVGNVNLIEKYFVYFLQLFFLLFLRKIRDALKCRYNYD